MTQALLILGAGGHGRSVAEAAVLCGWERVTFLDDSYPNVSAGLQWPVVGRVADIEQFAGECSGAVVAVGNNAVRERWVALVEQAGLPLVSLVHPTAWVSPSAELGAGSAVMAGAVVGSLARVGRASIINANATVDHDAVLGDFAHLGVGVQLAGGVRVGARAWLQAGCCCGYGVVIEDGVTLRPGAVLG